jgi:hypothetical protein
LVGKLISHRTTLGSAATLPRQCHFPTNAGLIFLTDELTNDRYLVDTGATLSIVPCNKIPTHLAPFSEGRMGSRVQRFLNLDDIYPSLETCWPVHTKFFYDVFTAELSKYLIKI